MVLCQSYICPFALITAPVRLQDGPTFGEGRVELFNDLTGSWGSICADQWDLNAANTACLQMGFSAASEGKAEYIPPTYLYSI